ncbi:hypothetical protein NPIL_438401, partial [Nephila pilipes]
QYLQGGNCPITLSKTRPTIPVHSIIPKRRIPSPLPRPPPIRYNQKNFLLLNILETPSEVPY